MSYIIKNSRDQIVAVVPDGTVNTANTSLTLVGRAVTSYGTAENENYVYLLENFANNTAPLTPVLGQLWYNSDTDVLSSYSNANTWVALASQAYVEAAKISPAFTGVPTAPTAVSGTANTQIATTAFVTNSPAFAGTPTAPTAVAGTANTQLATTAFVINSPAFAGVPTAPTAPNGTTTTQLATTAFVSNSPVFYGTPTAPTAATATSNTQIATTEFVQAQKEDTVLTGTPAAPTPSTSDDSTRIATTAFVQAQKISPIFAGAPLAPTASNSTSNTQIATTEFVSNFISSAAGGALGSIATQNANNVSISGGAITGISALAIPWGGTGATSAANARINLGIGNLGVQFDNAVNITGGTITGITPLDITAGGTNASTAVGARTNLGLGSMATQSAGAVAITGGTISGITSLAINDGGTGATNAANARVNLGLGTVATQDFNNVNITGGAVTGVTITGGSVSGLGNALAIADGGTGATTQLGARTALGLASGATTTVGTIATQNASNVNITGGTITGITPLAVTYGGTGASIPSAARTNIGAASSGITITGTSGLTGGGDLTSNRTLTIATDSNGYGTRTVSSALPSGGSNGDIWYQI